MSKKNMHYLAAVTKLGDSEEITTSKNIYSDSGVLLLGKGSRINSQVFAILGKHRLQEELDDVLSIGDAITNARLFKELRQELSRFPPFQRMMRAIPNPFKLEDHLRHIYLDDMMRNKVTVAYKSFPALFAHSLRVAICAAMVGIYCELTDEECEWLATAGLFHDLGDMHLAPELFDPARILSPEEKRAIYTHPLVMFHLLKRRDAYHPHISVPVLEHHERVNGSGYPQRKLGYSNKLGAVLALVEVIVSMRERYTIKRVGMALLGQLDLFDHEVIQALARATQHMGPVGESEVPAVAPVSQSELNRLQLIICQWREVQSGLDLDNLTNLQQQLVKRIQGIQQMLVRGGIELSGADALAAFAGDKVAMMEAYYLLEEALYSLRELHLELARKYNNMEVETAGESVAAWLEQLGKLICDFEAGLGWI